MLHLAEHDYKTLCKQEADRMRAMMDDNPMVHSFVLAEVVVNDVLRALGVSIGEQGEER